MLDIKRFQQNMTTPSRANLEKASAVIENNLTEIGIIVAHVSGNCPLANDADRRKLLYLCSCLYDFYLLVEEGLLKIACITDRWIPA